MGKENKQQHELKASKVISIHPMGVHAALGEEKFQTLLNILDELAQKNIELEVYYPK